ncbi:MAG: hypothetical protein MUE86_01435 [Thiobacillaceae bacterium]|jgi:hypothetical protein|nr:hypothetical protein [Thiobacillaceae bacterium]
MKPSIATVVTAGLLVLFSAHASATDAPLAIDIDGSKRLVPTGVVQTQTDEGLVVSGWIEKSWPYRGRILGHVDVEVRKRNGEILSVQQGALFGRTPSAKDPERARFSVTLAALPEDAGSILIRHHVGGH